MTKTIFVILFTLFVGHAAHAQCVGGVNGTAQTPSYLLTNEFQDGQAAGSITPACVRDLIATQQTVSPTGATSASQLAGNVPLSITNFGAVASTDAPSCTAVGGNASMTCSGTLTSFAAGQHITMQINGSGGPGPTSALSQPSIAVAATTLDGSVYLPTSGCHVTASVGSISSGSNSLNVNDTRLYGIGDSITVAGAGAAGGALATTVSSANVTNLTLTLAANASTTVAVAAVTGFNCSTTWRYQVAAVDSLGGKSQASSIVQITTGASELSPSNYNTITLNTVSNAVAYLLYSCKGGGCTPALVGMELPNQTYNAGGDPLLLTYNSRTTPTTITFHDFGLSSYLQDTYGSTTAPGAQTKQQLDTTIVSVSGSTVVLSVAPTNSGTFVMRHDNGPAISAAITAACSANIAIDRITPGIYDVGTTFSSGGSTCFSESFRGTASGYNEGNHFVTAFNWVGPLGGTVFNASGLSGINTGGYAILAGENGIGGSTPGIGIDFDQAGAPAATQGTFDGITITNAGIGMRFCNSGVNCDFETLHRIDIGGSIGSGYGIYNNVTSSLSFDLNQFELQAVIGVFSTAGGGNMNLTHGSLNGVASGSSLFYGGIGFWMRNYSATAIRFQDVHSEYATKFFYAGGDNNNINVELDNVRMSRLIDWDGYIIRIGIGQITIIGSLISTDVGATVGSAGPEILLESGYNAVDLGGNNLDAYPALVGGGGGTIGLGSLYITQTGSTSSYVSNYTQGVQLGFPAAVTGSIGGGALGAGACTSGTATVTGATTGMAVSVAPVSSPLVDSSHGLAIWGYVSSSNTVTVEVCAIIATTPTARVYNVRVLQ